MVPWLKGFPHAMVAVAILNSSFVSAEELSRQCNFNAPAAPSNAMIGKLGNVPKTTEKPNQGWVQDHNSLMSQVQTAAAGLYWGNCNNNQGNSDATAEETYALQCAAENTNAYRFEGINSLAQLANLPANHMDDLQEELIFLSAANNIFDFATCQNGLFSEYFDAKNNKRQEMLDVAFSEFQKIAPKATAIYKTIAPAEVSKARADYFQNCIKDSCQLAPGGKDLIHKKETEALLSKQDQELNILLSGIPMANREKMQVTLKQLLRSNPNASKEQFSAIFDQQMKNLKGDVDSTLKFLNTIRKVGPDGKAHYCVDNSLKRQFYRSGQVELVMQGLKVEKGLEPLNCRLGKRYGYAGEIISELALLPTYVVGAGIPYAWGRLAARFGVSAAKTSRIGKALTLRTEPAMLGLQGVDLAIFANNAAQSCMTKDFMTGVQGASCSAESEFSQAMHEAQTGQCIANIALFGVSNVAAVAMLSKAKAAREVANAPKAVPTATTTPLLVDEVKEIVVSPGQAKTVSVQLGQAGKNTDELLKKLDFDKVSSTSAAHTFKHESGAKIILPTKKHKLTAAQRSEIEKILKDKDGVFIHPSLKEKDFVEVPSEEVQKLISETKDIPGLVKKYSADPEYASLFKVKKAYPEQHDDLALIVKDMEKSFPDRPKSDIRKAAQKYLDDACKL